jgi:putative alpha-1,2-mannosidase
LGSPSVNSAKINLENGKTFTIRAINQSPKNVYVKKVTLIGKDITNKRLKHNDIINGGELLFYMTATHR